MAQGADLTAFMKVLEFYLSLPFLDLSAVFEGGIRCIADDPQLCAQPGIDAVWFHVQVIGVAIRVLP